MTRFWKMEKTTNFGLSAKAIAKQNDPKWVRIRANFKAQNIQKQQLQWWLKSSL